MNVVMLVCVAAPIALSAGGYAQKPGTQTPRTFRKRVVTTYTGQYLLYLPLEYDKDRSRRWPLMIFLHGAGERGTDLEKVKTHGPPKLVAQGKEFPFILVSPQCPEGQWWDTGMLNALLDTLLAKYRVDPDRVYLTGLSMGGFATWAWAEAHPERFAAIAPICGGGDPFLAWRLKSVPVWAFHGAKDPVVPVKMTTDMVDALKSVGGDVRLTIYPEAGHDAWTDTYNNQELYDWFLQHQRRASGGK
ncbi:MAG: prolyl oligopeptidase family serine peptidase [Chthonomonadales bacterium]